MFDLTATAKSSSPISGQDANKLLSRTTISDMKPNSGHGANNRLAQTTLSGMKPRPYKFMGSRQRETDYHLSILEKKKTVPLRSHDQLLNNLLRHDSLGAARRVRTEKKERKTRQQSPIQYSLILYIVKEYHHRLQEERFT